MTAGKKITIVGAGNVGATVAHIAAQKALGDIVLVDVIKGLAEGKALDICQGGALQLSDYRVVGACSWEQTSSSDIIIVTSGVPRKPGMSRDDLLLKNVQIVKDVSQQIKKYSPDGIVIVVCNPLDAMVYAASKVTGFAKSRIVGMAGALDCARFNYFVARKLSVSVKEVQSIIMGGHGDDMVPLVRFASVRGTPLVDLLDQTSIKEVVEHTREGGLEIVNLLGSSAYYAPAAGVIEMAEVILKDKKTVLSCCAYCSHQYNVGGYFIGVPVVLGAGGVEKILELDLNEHELLAFENSVDHVKELAAKVDQLLCS